MPAGRIRSWIKDKGFGFIQPSEGGEELFCHASELQGGDGSVAEGDYVAYVLKYDARKGKERAAEVEVTSYLRAGYDAEHSPIPERVHGHYGSGDFGAQEKLSKNFPDNAAPSNAPMGDQFGKMVQWNLEKHFGFIKPDADGEDLFCHVSALVYKEGSVSQGDRVSYTKEFNTVKQKYLAINVRRDTTTKDPVREKDKAAERRGGKDGDKGRGRDGGRGKENDRHENRANDGDRRDDRDKDRGRGKSRDKGRKGDRDKDKDRRRSKSRSRSRSRGRERRDSKKSK